MRTFQSTWTHMRRSPYQSMAATLSMFLTMLLAGFFFLATAGSALVLQYFESKPQLTVFFADKATKADADALQKTVEDTGKVASVKFVSKEDALAIYREQNKSDPLLLEMVTADILPASLEISAKDPAFLAQLDPIIKQANGVEEVIFQKDVVDELLKWTNAVRIIGLVLVGFFAVNAVLIIMTVIGMKIALKKEEVEILKLVGASPWYIRLPFIIEGGLYGVFGAFGSWVIITGITLWLRPNILAFLGMIPTVHEIFANPTSAFFLLSYAGFLGILLLVGFLLGSAGSMVALRRYLKF